MTKLRLRSGVNHTVVSAGCEQEGPVTARFQNKHQRQVTQIRKAGWVQYRGRRSRKPKDARLLPFLLLNHMEPECPEFSI